MIKTMKRTLCFVMCSYICFTATAFAQEDWTQVRRYTHHSDLQQQWFNSLTKDLKVTDRAYILDYGSRDGKFTSQLALLYPDATMIGAESDQNMLSWAKRRYPSDVFRTIQFETIDTLFHGQHADTIDHIISVNRLYREAESPETLRNLHRILKAEGTLHIVGPGEAGVEPLDVAFKVIRKEYHFKDPKQVKQPLTPVRNPKHLSELLEKAGFKVVRSESLGQIQVFPDKEELHGWIMGSIVPAWHIPEENADEFCSKVIDEFLKCYPKANRPDGSIGVPMVRVEAVAIKKA